MAVWGCEVTTSASPLVPRGSCASVAISAQASGKVVRRTCPEGRRACQGLTRWRWMVVHPRLCLTRTTTPERLRAASWRTRSSLGSRCGCFPQLCSRRHAVHARTLLYAQFANKRSTPHRYHTAASPWPVSRTFQLGGLGVRSHNFCEVVTSGRGVLL